MNEAEKTIMLMQIHLQYTFFIARPPKQEKTPCMIQKTKFPDQSIFSKNSKLI